MRSQSEKAHSQRWTSLAFLCVSLLVLSLNNNSLNVALPSIAESLHATSSELQWVIDAYILIFAALLLTMGTVGDRYGRKRALTAGLVLFALGSVLAGFSASVSQLILLRGFMGIAGAMIMPATLSILSASFPDPKERSQAIALWAATFGLGIGIGPVVAGWLLVSYSWNSAFFVNVPVIAIALIGSYIFVSDSRDERAPSVDLLGCVLSVIGLVVLLYGIIQAGVKGWTDSGVLTALALAAVFLIAFIFWERRAENAMLPMYLFENRSFTGANIALSLIMFSTFGSSFFLGQYFQAVLGHTALSAGIAILPLAITIMITSALSSRVSAILGPKKTVLSAILISALGFFYFAAVAGIDTSYPTLLVGMIIIGIGLGTATGPATDLVMSAVPVAKAGVGSAMNDTTRELGGALGVAVLGTIMNSKFLSELDRLTILNILPAKVYETIRSGIEGAHQFATYIPFPQVQEQFLVYVNKAFVSGMKEAMFVGAAIMVGAAVLAYLILPNSPEPAA